MLQIFQFYEFLNFFEFFEFILIENIENVFYTSVLMWLLTWQVCLSVAMWRCVRTPCGTRMCTSLASVINDYVPWLGHELTADKRPSYKPIVPLYFFSNMGLFLLVFLHQRHGMM